MHLATQFSANSIQSDASIGFRMAMREDIQSDGASERKRGKQFIREIKTIQYGLNEMRKKKRCALLPNAQPIIRNN